MMSLGDAWAWYDETRAQLRLFGRFGQKYWEDLDWGGPIGKDDHFKTVEADEIIGRSERCLEHLNDFAVLILFSVFESIVRDKVLEDITAEKTRMHSAQVKQIVDDALEGIEHGSVFRVLGLFKKIDAGLVEEVNQVRRYRNWVAHGRRSARPETVDPPTAFDRLNRFLVDLTEAAS